VLQYVGGILLITGITFYRHADVTVEPNPNTIQRLQQPQGVVPFTSRLEASSYAIKGGV